MARVFQVPIKRAVAGVPGGLVVVPFASASSMVTLFPDTPRFLGSFTGALSAVKVGIRILLGVSFGRIPGEATMARARRVGARVG